MSRKSFKVFFDGQMKEADAAFIEKISPGVIPSLGAFETLLAYGERVLLLKRHIKRLMMGLKLLGLKSPHSSGKIRDLVTEVLKENSFKISRLRILCWKKRKDVHFALVALPYKPYSKAAYKKGFSVSVFKRFYPHKFLSAHVKALPYKSFARVLHKALQEGYDEAIIINEKGQLVEGARTNIFYVREGFLMTPSLATGALKGIARQKIMEIARQRNIKVRETLSTWPDLLDSDEVFLTNSLMQIMPVTKINHCLIRDGKPGVLTSILMKAYKEAL